MRAFELMLGYTWLAINFVTHVYKDNSPVQVNSCCIFFQVFTYARARRHIWNTYAYIKYRIAQFIDGGKY